MDGDAVARERARRVRRHGHRTAAGARRRPAIRPLEGAVPHAAAGDEGRAGGRAGQGHDQPAGGDVVLRGARQGAGQAAAQRGVAPGRARRPGRTRDAEGTDARGRGVRARSTGPMADPPRRAIRQESARGRAHVRRGDAGPRGRQGALRRGG